MDNLEKNQILLPEGLSRLDFVNLFPLIIFDQDFCILKKRLFQKEPVYAFFLIFFTSLQIFLCDTNELLLLALQLLVKEFIEEVAPPFLFLQPSNNVSNAHLRCGFKVSDETIGT